MKKYLLYAFCGALAFAACTKENGVGIMTKEDYTGAVENGIPAYSDYYVDVAGWDFRSNWNLANVHDPSIAYYNGYYYMFGTDASYGNEHDKASIGRHFQGKRSKDLVNWTHVYGPLNDAPTWVKDSLNSMRGRMDLKPIDNPTYGYWAPVIRVVDGKMRMYYSIIVDNFISTGKKNVEADFDKSWTERAFIGVCETTTPDDPDSWVDKGFVTCSSSDKGANGWARENYRTDYNAYFYFNAIDPTYIVDPDGKHWLIYGSWHSGFALLEINAETGLPVNAYDDGGNFVGLGDPWSNSADELQTRYGVRVGTRALNSRWQGSEAPEIVYKDGYYYLFMAYDGLDIPYNTRVVRSQNIAGPYTDITGRNFTNGRGDTYPIVTHPYKFSGNDGWVGIAHCCIFQQEGTGDWFYCSQGRLPIGVNGNNSSNALMMGHVRRIEWVPSSAENLSDLWPLVLPERYAGLSKKAVAASEIPGTYEYIDLHYTKPFNAESVAEKIALQNAQICPSENVEFATDGSISGAFTGTWAFDESTQFLTITPEGGAKFVVKVAHEADWERTKEVVKDEKTGETEKVMDRQETVVFTGIGTPKDARNTSWGKKID